MGYVPDFEWDVFISYSHIDNKERWVDRFHELLQNKLDAWMGQEGEVTIWRDEKLDRAQLFDEVIENRLNRAVVLLALCSNGYMRSEYCKKELKWFHERREELDDRLQERSRIVKVRLYDIPHDEFSEQFGKTVGFDFFNEELGGPQDPESKQFRENASALRDAICKILEAMRPSPEETEEGEADVFVGEVCDTQRPFKKRLIHDLEVEGLKVVDRVPPPHQAKEHREKVLSALNRCKLSVHLLDAWGDDPIDDDDSTTYGRAQVELAQGHEIPQLIWIPPRIKLSEDEPEMDEDNVQRSFLQSLEGADRNKGTYSIIRNRSNELVSIVKEKLEDLNKDPVTDDGPPAVLLDTHVKDQEYAWKTSELLREMNIQPLINPEQEDPRKNTALLEEQLKKAQALIIFYGEVSEDWVIARLLAATEIQLATKHPLKTCGIFMAPPDEDKSETRFLLPWLQLHVLDNRKGFDAASLLPFLAGLGAA